MRRDSSPPATRRTPARSRRRRQYVLDQLIDLRFRADVDADRRLVEQKDVDVARHARAPARTFCRLPPESWRPRCSMCGGRSWSCSRSTVRARRSSTRRSSRPRAKVGSRAMPSTRSPAPAGRARGPPPPGRRGNSRCRRFSAARGDGCVDDRPRTRISPAVDQLQPEGRPDQLRLAAADEPGDAHDLAGTHVELEASSTDAVGQRQPLDREQRLAGRAADLGNSAPTRARSSVRSVACRSRRGATVVILRPSRSTVIRSASRLISAQAVRDIDDATPAAFSRAISSNSRPASASVSEAVGSSRISSRTSVRSALAISTIC